MNINFIKKNLTIIVLCGGKGERLKPLTNNTPKPLIKINNETILFRILKHLIYYKLNHFIIASGYKSEKIKKFIKKKKNFLILKFYILVKTRILFQEYKNAYLILKIIF